MAITDNFNRAALGANWEAAEGTVWTINGSTTVRPVSTYTRTAIIRTEAAFPNDQYAQADIQWTNTADQSYGGLMVRGNGANTYYLVRFDTGNVGGMTLYKRVAGAETYLGDVAASQAASGATVTVKLEAIGTAIKVYVGGVEKISATDSAIASGKPGLHAFTGNQAIDFDNFECTDASAGASRPMFRGS